MSFIAQGLIFICLLSFARCDLESFSGSIQSTDTEPTIQCRPESSADACETCTRVCQNIFRCVDSADIETRSGSAANTFGLLSSTSARVDEFCEGPWEAQFFKPLPSALVPDPNAAPGALVVPSLSARVTFTPNQQANFQANSSDRPLPVIGNMVAQCDGMTLYISPGGLCDCQRDYFVTSGNVLGVSSDQETFDPVVDSQPKNIGQIYGLRVKQNPSEEEFRACNATFMGEHFQEDENGREFPVQCFRTFTVAESRVSRYNRTVCGTQLSLFNSALEENQGVDNCRDGVGVVTDGASISGQPAGVFFNRFVEEDDVDPQWFFSLTPAVLPLNSSAQLDLKVTRLSGPAEQRTQLTCIAEYRVQPLPEGAEGTDEPILGFSYEESNSGALPLRVIMLGALVSAILLVL